MTAYQSRATAVTQPIFVLPNPDYATHPDFRSRLDGLNDSLRNEALTRFLPHFEDCFQRYLNLPRINYDARIQQGDALLRQLQETGCGTLRIEPERKAALSALTLPVAEAVHRKLEQIEVPRFKQTQFIFSRQDDHNVFAAVDRALEDSHVHAATAAYCGRRLSLKSVTVQVNTERMTRMEYGELDAQGLPSPSTRYMHIDSAIWPPVKVLIYLSEVTADEGPFRYAEGSHRMATGFELMVRKVNDRQGIHGELFMALPEPFRMNTLFGDDTDPDCEAARRLLGCERACDNGDDLILFDFNGVHRGGFVRKGHRYMLQCHFERG
jgi:hypothetical protein